MNSEEADPSWPEARQFAFIKPMKAPRELEKSLRLCDAVFQILSEENRLLKNEGRGFSRELLKTKKTLVDRLHSNVVHQAIWDPDESNSPNSRRIECVRSRLLQILNLERDNEQMRTRLCLAGVTIRNRLPSPSPRQLERIYRRTLTRTIDKTG